MLKSKMNASQKVLILALAGLICSVLIAYADDETTHKPFDSPEDELKELMKEHEDTTKECKELREKGEKEKKDKGFAMPETLRKITYCEDFLKVLEKSKEAVKKHIKKDDSDSDDSDSDSD